MHLVHLLSFALKEFTFVVLSARPAIELVLFIAKFKRERIRGGSLRRTGRYNRADIVTGTLIPSSFLYRPWRGIIRCIDTSAVARLSVIYNIP